MSWSAWKGSQKNTCSSTKPRSCILVLTRYRQYLQGDEHELGRMEGQPGKVLVHSPDNLYMLSNTYRMYLQGDEHELERVEGQPEQLLRVVALQIYHAPRAPGQLGCRGQAQALAVQDIRYSCLHMNICQSLACFHCLEAKTNSIFCFAC